MNDRELAIVLAHALPLRTWSLNYKIGDLVIEITSWKFDPDRIGRVVSRGVRDGDRFVEIETLDGERKRWFNADFRRVPSTPEEFDAWRKS